MTTESNNTPATLPIIGAIVDAAHEVTQPTLHSYVQSDAPDLGATTTAQPEIVGGTNAAEGSTSTGATEGSTETAQEATPLRKKRAMFDFSWPMFVLAIVLMVAAIWLASFGITTLLILMFGELAGSLMSLAITLGAYAWLAYSKNVDGYIETYLGWFAKKPETEAQRQAAADVAASFAAQASAEGAAFEGAVPA